MPEELKTERLNELIALQNELSLRSNKSDIGKSFEIMIEGTSKRNDKEVFGRTQQNKVVIIADENFKAGDRVNVIVTDVTSATMFGKKA